MATDPIKLVKNILEPKTTTAAKKTETKSADAAKTETSGKATESPKNDAAYKLSSSLNSALSGTKSAGSRTQELANYTAKGLKESFQKARAEDVAEAKANTKTTGLDNVLSASRKKGTNEPKLSAQAQAIIDEGKKSAAKATTAADAGTKAVEAERAKTAGISTAIGTA